MMSKIFTAAEIKSIKDRFNGLKSDKTGIFSARVRPKIIEMLEIWLPKRKELNNLVQYQSRKADKDGRK